MLEDDTSIKVIDYLGTIKAANDAAALLSKVPGWGGKGSFKVESRLKEKGWVELHFNPAALLAKGYSVPPNRMAEMAGFLKGYEWAQKAQKDAKKGPIKLRLKKSEKVFVEATPLTDFHF